MEFVKDDESGVESVEVEDEDEDNTAVLVRVEAKWRGQVFDFGNVDINSTCVRDLKMMASQETSIPAKRIKLIGVFGAAGTSENDVIMLNQYEKKIKKGKMMITVMGTPPAELDAFEQGGVTSGGGEGVLNDFNHNFTPASKEWHNLKRFTDSLEINFIQEPRPGKKLLVLDLDHTILDFSSRENISAEQMKRPFMDFFLETMYEYYDIAIWSQTHWKWVEIKLIELGIINNPKFRLCFMLDKSSMFRSGAKNEYIKPLHIIWSKFPHIWGRHNTLHIDDLKRNFAMNIENGIVCSAFYRDEARRQKKMESQGQGRPWERQDNELVLLSRYLIHMAGRSDVSKHSHERWWEEAVALIQGGDSASSSSSSSDVKKAS